MSFLKCFNEILDMCYCRVLPVDDEIATENTNDTIVPPDFVPVNEAKHQNPFETSYSFTTLIPP